MFFFCFIYSDILLSFSDQQTLLHLPGNRNYCFSRTVLLLPLDTVHKSLAFSRSRRHSHVPIHFFHNIMSSNILNHFLFLVVNVRALYLCSVTGRIRRLFIFRFLFLTVPSHHGCRLVITTAIHTFDTTALNKSVDVRWNRSCRFLVHEMFLRPRTFCL